MSKETMTQGAVGGADGAASKRAVVVIGGGPGGSTAAALLAREGKDVLLLEREVFPRYHIGESLAVSCRIIMELSGAVDTVDSAGFLTKRGALLQWGAEDDWTIDWNALFGAEAKSWHVDRDKFDEILLANAEKQGAEVIQGATVKKVDFDGDRPVAVEWVRNSEPDRLLTTHFDFLIDASGRAGVLSAQKFRNRHPHEIFRNVAVWGYWQGGATLPNTPEGGINVLSSPEGWYWIIPLQDQRFSVGFVTHKDNFLKRRAAYASNEEMLLSVINEHDTVRSLLKEGTYYAPVRVEQDFSYVAEHFCGPNYVLVGDAACFLDPLLSTGVHLAMYSAMLASGVILSNTAGEVSEGEGRAFYESLYRHAYARLLVLVSGVYEQYAGKANYFWLAQRMVKGKNGAEKSNHAFVELTTGLTDISDAEDVAGWSGAEGLQKEMELAKERADKQTAASGKQGIIAVKLEPSDLHDKATGLYLVTTPRLGLRQTDSERQPA
jgi:flavin-dependent dehydrogenase